MAGGDLSVFNADLNKAPEAVAKLIGLFHDIVRLIRAISFLSVASFNVRSPLSTARSHRTRSPGARSVVCQRNARE